MPILNFSCTSGGRTEQRTFNARNLVLAGWTGRDRAAVEHHIEELGALGISPPSQTPVFYRTGVELAVQTDHLQVLGPDTSGEVEYVLLRFDDGLWFTVGSDQTDRKAEAMGIALSKQLAGKVIANHAYRLEDYSSVWDSMMIRSWATIDGDKVLYQEASIGSILSPAELIEKYTGGPDLAPGTIMMSGTPGAIGGIRPAARFDMEITHTASRQSITHGYDIEILPVVT